MIEINGCVFGAEEFHNGETIFLEPIVEENKNTITLRFETVKDISNLMIAKSYLDEKVPNSKKELLIPYLPYSRMDRKINNQVFTLKHFADMLNSMNFDKVIVCDAHSDVSYDLINNLENFDIENIIKFLIKQEAADVIMFPDAGAKKKYSEVYKQICNQNTVIYGNKKRDLENKGKIKSYEIVTNDFDISGKTVFIIDDIASFGNTFVLAAKELLKLGAKKVVLFVTHAENAIFEGELFTSETIDVVYTTNSIVRTKTHKQLMEIKLF